MRKVKEEIQCSKNLLLKTWHWSLFLSNPLKVLFSPFLACVFILLEVLANGCCCFASLALLLNILKCIFSGLALNHKSYSNVRFSWGTQKTSKSPLRLLCLKTKHTQIHQVAQIKSQATVILTYHQSIPVLEEDWRRKRFHSNHTTYTCLQLVKLMSGSWWTWDYREIILDQLCFKLSQCFI